MDDKTVREVEQKLKETSAEIIALEEQRASLDAQIKIGYMGIEAAMKALFNGR